MAHNRVVSTQAMARSKKIDSQTTICKLLLPKKMGVLAAAGSMPAHKKCSTLLYKIVPHVVCGFSIRGADYP